MGSQAIGEKKLLGDDPKKIAENLNVLLEDHNLSQNQLAQALGIPMMTIRRLASGETTDPRISTLKLIADYFNISLDTLVEGAIKEYQMESLKKGKPHFVPLLGWDTAEKFIANEDFDLSSWKKWQPVPSDGCEFIHKNVFALESRPSMYPRFPHGSIFIIDPNLTPVDGDIVLVNLIKNNELTLRELAIDPPQWQLNSISPGSSNTLQFSTAEHKIVGVNLLTLLYNRKA